MRTPLSETTLEKLLVLPPKNPVVDRRLLGSDGTVLYHPHAGHVFPAGEVFPIKDRAEAFFDLEGVKGCDCGKQPCCDHNFLRILS